jgi:hypothetical protein
MPLRRIALAAATLPLAFACAGGDDDPEPAGLVPLHAATSEPNAASPMEEADDGIDARPSMDERPNLRAIAGWDFEPASADCNGWTASAANAIRAIPSHSGAYACKLCSDGSAPEMKLTRRVAGLARGHWVVSAWLRRPGTSKAAMAARITLDEATARAGVPVPLEQDWFLLGEPREIEHDVASTELSIVATAPAGECILVDDVVVESATARAALTSFEPSLVHPSYSTNRAPRNDK